MKRAIPKGMFAWTIFEGGGAPGSPAKPVASDLAETRDAVQQKLRAALPAGPVAQLQYEILNSDGFRVEHGPAVWLLRPEVPR